MIRNIGSITSSDGTSLLKMWSVSVPSGNRVLQRHGHICFEITLVERGSGVYTVGEKDYRMEKGDIFIFASNEQHCITEVSSKGLEIINLHFEPRYLWGYSADSLSEESINLCFSHNKDFENRIKESDASELKKIFHKIKAEFEQQNKEYKLTVKSLLNLFLIRLIRDFDYSEQSTPLRRDRLHSIRRVINYIDNHLCEDLSLISLSDIAGMTPNYFSSLFHNVSGITLWDYINSKRIDKAIRLLNEKDITILEIAVSCGFNNTANFNKAFKKVTGMTPTQYRSCGELII